MANHALDSAYPIPGDRLPSQAVAAAVTPAHPAHRDAIHLGWWAAAIIASLLAWAGVTATVATLLHH